MAVMELRGGAKLEGEAYIHGAKNAALPILAACAAIDGEFFLEKCPPLSDVINSLAIIRGLGGKALQNGQSVRLDCRDISCCSLSQALASGMRSSIIFLGSLLARCGEARLYLPGGCELGARPIEQHLAGLRRMGARIEEQHGQLLCSAENGLYGASVPLALPSVGATENIMIAAALAKGETTITNAACEPEIIDLARFLNRCGAKIIGQGTPEIRIEGVKKLHGCEYEIIPDRIETFTYLAAAAMCRGDVRLRGCVREHLVSALPFFEELGCVLEYEENIIRIKAGQRLRGGQYIRTMPYPGFPTDAQAPAMAAMCVANGTGIIVETVFDSRFKHVPELNRLGAKIKTDGRVAVIEGVSRLEGAAVCATDLRGAAALMLAGLAAEGKTEISRLEHLLRGYCEPDEMLGAIGASCVIKPD